MREVGNLETRTFDDPHRTLSCEFFDDGKDALSSQHAAW